MAKKNLEVVELNKKKEEIILEEKQSPLVIFLRNNRRLILLALFLLSLITLIIGSYLLLKSINSINGPNIEKATLDTSLGDYNYNINSGLPITEDSALNKFKNSGEFKVSGEVTTVKIIESSDFVVKLYSDGTALKIMKKNNLITRVNPQKDGSYGVDAAGNILTTATTKDVKISSTKEYRWGSVTYFSDGSAEITNAKINLFVRNGQDINDNYIANHKVSYLKETKTIGQNKLSYYYDGTIVITNNNKNYIIRNESDMDITNDKITFKNNNAYEIYKTITLDDGIVIDYYQDGGAIIKDGTKTISVRRSNSIHLANNKIYEIVDDIYVEISHTIGNTTYYTTGGATYDLNGKTYYVDENSNIKYQNNQISDVTGEKEELTKTTNIDGEEVKTFEKTAVIKTKDYIAIVPKDGILYDKAGKIKDTILDTDIDDTTKDFTITNNTNETLNYRIVIEESSRTNLDVEYIRYQIQAGSTYVGPTKLKDKLWKNDPLFKLFSLIGTNYTLVESTIEPYETKDVKLMLWTDYETIPNSMQNKYFYGTIKIYAWSKK